jgi:UDPglucose 6-dehydrogenase
LTLVRALTKMGAHVKVFDPVSIENCQRSYPDLEVSYCETVEDLAKDSDALVLVTEWQEFATADWKQLIKSMRWPLVIDGRNILPQDLLTECGAIYRGIGH